MSNNPNSEAATLAKATALGVALASFRMCQYPALFCAWADRVAQADVLRTRGQLTDADLDECDRQIGIPASRIKQDPTLQDPILFVPSAQIAAPGWLTLFRDDPLDGIARAMRAFWTEEAEAAS